jgi:hypothetical protein
MKAHHDSLTELERRGNQLKVIKDAHDPAATDVIFAPQLRQTKSKFSWGVLLAVLVVASSGCDSDLDSEDDTTSSTQPNKEINVADVPSDSEFRETAVWGGEPGGVQFEALNGLAVDSDGRVYSTDFQAGYLRRFSPTGVFVEGSSDRTQKPVAALRSHLVTIPK